MSESSQIKTQSSSMSMLSFELMLQKDPFGAISSFRAALAEEYSSEVQRTLFSVKIDRDPTVKSPAVLYERLNQAREYANTLATCVSSFFQRHVVFNRAFQDCDARFKRLVSKGFVSHSDELKGLRSDVEKVRYVEALIPDEDHEKLLQLRLLADEAKSYYNHFKLRYDQMVDTKDDILKQLGILNTMISLRELGTGLSKATPVEENTVDNLSYFKSTDGPREPEGTISF